MKNTKQDHLSYIKNNPLEFEFSFRGFSESEVDFIEKYGPWLEALRTGLLEPLTPKQHEVVDELNSKIPWQDCKTQAGIWKKYLRSRILEKNGHVMHAPPASLADNSFGTREEFKAMRKGQFSTISKSHQS